MGTILIHDKKNTGYSADVNPDDHNSVASMLVAKLCSAFRAHMPIIRDQILKHVENPKKLPKEFTYDEDMFREYFYDKFFSKISDEIYEMERRYRLAVEYTVHAAVLDDSSIYVSVVAQDDILGIPPIVVRHCRKHETQFFIQIVEEESFKYTVVQPDKSVETFYIPKGDGSKSVTVRDKNVFVYRDLMAEIEDTLVFARFTKKPVLNVVVTKLEEYKPE